MSEVSTIGVDLAKNLSQRLMAGYQRASALAAKADLVHRSRSRAFAPAVSTLAAPTNALTRPTALESLTAIQATARLGDVSALRHRLRIACHSRKLPRIATVANSTRSAALGAICGAYLFWRQ